MTTTAVKHPTSPAPQVMPLSQYVQKGELGAPVPGSQFSTWFGDSVTQYRAKSASTPWWNPFKPHAPAPQSEVIGTWSFAGQPAQPLHMGGAYSNSLEGLSVVIGSRAQAIAATRDSMQTINAPYVGNIHSLDITPMLSTVEARKGVYIVGGLEDSLGQDRDGLNPDNLFEAENIPQTPKGVPGIKLTATDPALVAAAVALNVPPLQFSKAHPSAEASIHSPVVVTPHS